MPNATRSQGPPFSERLSRTFSCIISHTWTDEGSYKPVPLQEYEIPPLSDRVVRSKTDGGLAARQKTARKGTYKQVPLQEDEGEGRGPRGDEEQESVPAEVARLCDGPEFLETWPAQCVTVFLMVSNAIVIGFETDLPDVCRWEVVETGYLAAFTVELVMRMYLHGLRSYFRILGNSDFVWNLTDLVIVGTGIFDLFMTAVLGSGRGTGKDMAVVRIMRMLRLLRILRIVRIVRFLKQLYMLVYGFVEGIVAVFWVAVLACFMLYIFSVVLVRMYGREDAHDGMDEADAEVLGAHFGTIPLSMFSLFELICAADLTPYRAVMFKNPPLVIFLTAFIVLGSFGVNGVLVALINESILEKNQARLEDERLSFDGKRRDLQTGCRELFDSLDAKKEGVLPRSELTASTPRLLQIFDSLGISVQRRDLDQLFYIIDYNDAGTIGRSEFLQGVLDLCEQIRPMSIMELQCQVSKCMTVVEMAGSNIEVLVKAVEQSRLQLSRLQTTVECLQG